MLVRLGASPSEGSQDPGKVAICRYLSDGLTWWPALRPVVQARSQMPTMTDSDIWRRP
jgi:hypothetical protein